MASWLVKALVQRGIGALPNPHYWNELLQARVTHSLDLTEERFEVSLRNCRNHLEQLQLSGSTATRSSFSALELGTGWFPTVPIGLFLCGAREVWTWDIAPLLRRDRLKLTIRRFLELEQGQGLRGHFHALPERLTRLREVMALCEQAEELGPAALLERLGIHYRTGRRPDRVRCRFRIPLAGGIIRNLAGVPANCRAGRGDEPHDQSRRSICLL